MIGKNELLEVRKLEKGRSFQREIKREKKLCCEGKRERKTRAKVERERRRKGAFRLRENRRKKLRQPCIKKAVLGGLLACGVVS